MYILHSLLCRFHELKKLIPSVYFRDYSTLWGIEQGSSMLNGHFSPPKIAFCLNHLKKPLPSIFPNISFKIIVNCCHIQTLHDGYLAKDLLTPLGNQSLWDHKCWFFLTCILFDRTLWWGLWITYLGTGSPESCNRESCGQQRSLDGHKKYMHLRNKYM